MEEINICSVPEAGGRTISRIFFGGTGQEPQDEPMAIFNCLPSGNEVFAVIDRRAFESSSFVSSLAAELKKTGAELYLIEATERSKTMDTVLEICLWLMNAGAGRDAFVLAVGGGITTDMTGFAASIYKRGVRFAYVPTTLLSQVDAAIGGKTGINLDRYKNMLGVIRQPEFVFISSNALESLPVRDFFSGAAEMLKTFVIQDDGNYSKAVGLLSDLHNEISRKASRSSLAGASRPSLAGELKLPFAGALKPFLSELSILIAAAVKVKAGIVTRDQFEDGERRKLNLGHTFAHAIETLARRRDMDITHGEAVAMGMVYAARAGVCTGIAECGFDDRLKGDLESCGLPVKCPFEMNEMSSVMQKDKKAEGGKVHFVIPRAIGDVAIMDLTIDEILRLLK